MTENLPEWFSDLLSDEIRSALREAARGQRPPVRAHALAPTARLLALASLALETDRPLLIATAAEQEARLLFGQLGRLLEGAGGPAVLRLPALDADPYRGLPVHPAVAAERVAVLDALAAGGPVAVILPVASLLTPVPPAEAIRAWGESIARGGEVEIERLARRAVAAGYRVVDVVTSPGDFARRGGLFDIWPPQEEAPLRVELWGDRVESVRRFDAATQRTVERVERFRWLPAREAPIDAETADRLLDHLVGRARAVLADVPATEAGLSRLLEENLAGIEGAVRLYRSDVVSLEEMAGGRWVVWDPEAVDECLTSLWEDLERAHEESDSDSLAPPEELFVPPDRVRRILRSAPVELAELPLLSGSAADTPGEGAVLRRELFDLRARPPHRLAGKLASLCALLAEVTAAGRPVILVVHTPGRRLRVEELLDEAGLTWRASSADEPWAPAAGEIVLVDGRLDEGLEMGSAGPLLLTEKDLFGADPPPPPPRKRRGGEAFLTGLRDLKPGDLVVHVDHGVARYKGLERRPVTGEEMLTLEYSGKDRLLVPVSRLDLIQKYSGGDQSLVPLDKLGGQGWHRRRGRVRGEVERIARELLELYARRQAVRAPSYGPDTPWQEEFEQAFPHALTHDQQGSLAEIKGDLAQGKPMDRLLCGDVGYGKTEVALRAAFKVVQEGWQVAVLVPTTVLAFQHLTTFRARMAGWPVRVEMVSRLVPPARVRQIIAETAEGKVDILLGTHRLLSQDVRFRRLGLLITDEEQRFGVKHKEAIKGISVGVHALAMSATPIPRTLQMSLAGARNLSVIETPPRNRLAIQTHLAPRSGSLIAAAIRNELGRGGQVYFIHPRVQGLEQVAAEIAELVPEARVAYAHGQMREGRLEKVMLEFIRGEAQVLVATSIVENGLDIPRANTIIIDQAHRFGLSQLYQMRGRVGRSDQRAYAYLLLPSRRDLTAEARRRLTALVEFSELGSGFRVAALDLEIRGAGEFLGARQSGHIAAVGFEMYNEMLERAVKMLKGEVLPEPPEPVTVNLGIPAHLPGERIPDAGQRLAIYKRLSSAESEAEIQLLREETVDRYGKLDEPAETLFRLAELRLIAASQGAVSIDWAGDGIVVRYGKRPKLDTERLIGLLQEDGNVRMTSAGLLKLRVPDVEADRIAAARVALRRLSPEGSAAAGAGEREGS